MQAKIWDGQFVDLAQQLSKSFIEKKNEEKLRRFDNLTVIQIPDATCAVMASLVQRTMQLQCTVQDGEIYLTAGDQNLTVTPQVRKLAD